LTFHADGSEIAPPFWSRPVVEWTVGIVGIAAALAVVMLAMRYLLRGRPGD
jgi:hypothetical protein